MRKFTGKDIIFLILFRLRNLRYFVESFMNRTDISEKLKGSLVCDTLLLVGDKSSFLHTTETMYQAADTTKTSILRLDDVGDVLVEAPEKVAQSILLFCQGMGLLTSLSSSERLVILFFPYYSIKSASLKLKSCQPICF